MSYPLANLALRRPTQASSLAPEEGVAAAAAVNGSRQGSASFRSLIETDAWWQVDLGRAVAIGRLQLWSAERAPLHEDAIVVPHYIGKGGRHGSSHGGVPTTPTRSAT